ncbi:TetR/AcrR family transcriptional regulator [Puia dinghuensis]|uniref:Transcriptional regulator n=1 Tax=Puia dinghuensis TaxID=1792502 RepID=A0A8J2UCH3_9BACT|nr:TetR/AcrR family transcriptional regulator [Puia dinghuensis]GGA98664.1 transcriptional regulator [Puia dinghuensis]
MSKAERTRQFIIEKTAPIFNTKGYAATSLSDMTDATGLTKGSIYGNFADKDEVALACFDHNHKHVREMIRQEMDKRSSYRDKLRVYVDVYGGTRKLSFVPGGCPILNTAIEAADTHPALKTKAAEAIVLWKERLMQLIEAGKANKEFKAATDAEQAALSIIALLEGMIMIRRTVGQPGYGKPLITAVENIIDAL